MKEPIILCVDDEKIVLNSLRRELYGALNEGYLIETAESGEEALDVFKEFLADGSEVLTLKVNQGKRRSECLCQ